MKLYVVTCILFAAVSAYAQRSLRNIPDPDPVAQKQTFNMAEGFEINLFASEPMIAKPVQMNWDADGRLWVVSSGIYPHIRPGQPANDKVVVLEDTDGDGIADKHTDFAEGLLIPTAIIPGDGGVYVGNSTELLHLKDTDGDGKADQRVVVLSGFGTEDTHHIIHTLRWGPGGDLYFNQSIYIHSHIETPHGPRRLLAGGVWRFRPESMELDVFTRGLINSWGTQFDKWGQWFQTDGAGSDGINYVYPGIVMRTAKGYSRIVRGLNPGQPKHCGLEIVSGEHFPDTWQQRLLTCDFRGNRINSFRLKEANSAYVSVKEEDIVSSSSVAFRPIDLRMGPDGALYIADWYNPIIQHGEVDFRDDRRDHTHGRIWRVTRKGAAVAKRPQIRGGSPEVLLDLLNSPSEWVRNQARLEFKKHAADKRVLGIINEKVIGSEKTGIEAGRLRLEALWACQQMRLVNEELLREVLESEDHRFRAAAIRVLADWMKDIADGYSALCELVNDPHPRVRLEVVNALRVSGQPDAVQHAVKVLNHDMDEHIDFALWLTLKDLEEEWLPHMATDSEFFGGKLSALIFAAKASDDQRAVVPLLGVLGSTETSSEDRSVVINLIGERGSPSELRLLFERAMAEPENAEPFLDALTQAAAKKKRRPSGALDDLGKLFKASDAVASKAVRLAGIWKINSLLEPMSAIAEDPDTEAGLRSAVLQGLSGFGVQAKPVLVKMIGREKDPLRQALAIDALLSVDPNAAAEWAVQGLKAYPENTNVGPLFSAFLGDKRGPEALSNALANVEIPSAFAREGIQAVARSGRKEPSLIKALEKAGALLVVRQGLAGPDLEKFIQEVNAGGKPWLGEKIYRRQGLLCLNCHAIGGSGGQVGPDLTSIGASAPVDYIVESLLEPMKKIKEGYHVTMLTRKNGAVAAGVLLNESDTTAFLRDGADNLIEVPKSDIAKREIVPTSLMPAGLTGSLRRDEMVDLVSFLSKLGKPGAYNVGNQAYVRSWQSLTGDRGEVDAVRHKGVHFPASNDASLRWMSMYSKVNGELPLAPVPTRYRNIGGVNYFFLRFQVEAKQDGKIKLDFNDPSGLQVWLDDKGLKDFDDIPLSVTRGVRWVTVAVQEDLRKGKALRVELLEVPDEDASAVLIHGK